MKAGGYLLAGMVGGIIGFVWTGFVFCAGAAFGMKLGERNKKVHECKGECGCQK